MTHFGVGVGYWPPVYDETVRVELSEGRYLQCADVRLQVALEESQEVVVGNVAGGDDQEATRRAPE